MEANWLRDRRQGQLTRSLDAPELSPEQRVTIRRMDGRWAMLGFTLQSRLNMVSRARTLAHTIGKPFEAATRADLENHLSTLATRGAPTSFVTFKRFLKIFYREMLTPGERAFPPVVAWISLKMPVGAGKLPRVILTPDEVASIAQACIHPRDRAIVMVLHDAAARPCELVSATVGDVELDSYGARLTLRGKTGERKVRLLGSVPDLKDWLNHHPKREDPSAPLFVSLGVGYRCEPVFQDGIGRALKGAARRAGIKRHVTPYVMRRTRLTELAKILSDAELKIFGGWSLDSKMVKVYVHLSGQDLDQKLLRAAGYLKDEGKPEANPLAARRCLLCGSENSAISTYCGICKRPLDEKELRALSKEHEMLEANLPKLMRILEDPRIREILAANPPA